MTTADPDLADSPTVALGEFTFECGESIPLEVAYETYGEYRGDSAERSSASDRTESGSNAVLVCHALTGSQHVTDAASSAPDGDRDQARGWWRDVVGPGKPIDTDRYFVVCANVPGGCYGTTGPASIDPETGEPYGTDFPPVTVGDWTRAQRRLLDHLGVDRLHAVVGGSVGGMNAVDWAKRYPNRVERVAAVAAAARLDPQCLALDAVARRAITSDPDWRGGDYYGRSHPDHGLAQARRVGHVMYLSKDSMREKFGRRVAEGRAVPGGASGDGPAPTAGLLPYREVESYLDYQADRFVDRFDANSYLYLLAAMDDYDLAAGHGSDADALAGFDGEALALSFTGDWHFTVEQSARLADAFRAVGASAVHHVVDSDYGHDAFLTEPDLVGPPLRDFLADGVRGRAVADAHGDEPERRHAPVHSSLLSD